MFLLWSVLIIRGILSLSRGAVAHERVQRAQYHVPPSVSIWIVNAHRVIGRVMIRAPPRILLHQGITTHPPAYPRIIISRTKVIIPTLHVPLFAGELVLLICLPAIHRSPLQLASPRVVIIAAHNFSS